MTPPRYFVTISMTLILGLGAQASTAQTDPESTQTLRPVRNNTILSSNLPKADLTLSKDFRYVGGQQVNLYGMADAEQHLFVKGDRHGVIDAFYWIQFEHRTPGDQHTYDYQLGHNTDIGGLDFVYDVKAWPDYATMQNEDPKSDGAAISRLLEKSNLKFPARAARVRMFHLPTPDHRTELMIIYGEALPQDFSIPVPKDGLDVAKESPTFSQKLLEDLKSQLTIRKK